MRKRMVLPLPEVLSVTGVISAFFRELPSDYRNNGEMHEGWEFVYLENGTLQVGAGENLYYLNRGEMICHQPGEHHKLFAVGKPASVIVMCFLCDSSRMDFFREKILCVGTRQKQYLHDIAALGKKLLVLGLCPPELGENPPDGGLMQMLKNTIELLILSLADAQTVDRRERIALYEKHRERRTMTEEICVYLREHLREPISLETFAGMGSYSLASIRRIFQEEVGCGIIAYLTELRMDRAKELLSGTSLSVEAVGGEVGYANVYHFSGAFKKHTGMSPTAYRKQNVEK